MAARRAGVLEHRVVVAVAGHRPAGVQHDVLVAVAIEIGEGDAVAFLQVPGAGRLGDVVEAPAGVVAQQDVRDQRSERRRAGPEIDVEEAVVVDVADVGAHRRHDARHAHRRGHIGEPVARVAIQLQRLRRGRLSEVMLDELLDRVRIRHDEQIEPAVVVVVEPPRREAGERLLHAQFRGKVLEGAVALVPVEEVVAEHVRRVEIGEPVVVVVAPRHALGEGIAGDTGSDRHVLERAVVLVAIEAARRQLVADVEVDPAVVVVVGPRRRVRREHAVGEAGGLGHVGEYAVTVVAQQRVAHRNLPAAAVDEQVEIAVVVVVGVAGVQAAELGSEPGRLGAILEGAVALVAKEPRRRAVVDRRQHDVEQAVAVEIVDDRAAGRAVGADAHGARHVREPRRRDLGAEQIGRQTMLRGHGVGMLAEQHRRQVQQPACLEVGGLAIGELREHAEGRGSARDVVVPAAGAQREQAPIRVGHHQAVVDLALAHRGDADRFVEQAPALRQIRVVGGVRRPARRGRP